MVVILSLGFNRQVHCIPKMVLGNNLALSEEQIWENVKSIQAANEISNEKQKLQGMNFTIEMETGTGKTYVYLRTIFELNKLYGFTKFVIVVPFRSHPRRGLEKLCR
jgi:restriction endonuclease